MRFPRSTPESQGLPSGAVTAWLDRLERDDIELHSVMLLRHGHVVAEGWWTPYHRDGVQLVYSLSKTFTSCAVAFAVDEGLLSLEDRLVALFPEAAHRAGPRVRDLTLHDVLSMSTGHAVDTLDDLLASDDPVAAYLSLEPEHERGSWFVYDNGASFLAGAAVQDAAHERLLDFLEPRLLRPLGVGPAAWVTTPDGRDVGFSGLHVRTEAIARLGQLLLDDGVWQGERLLPDGWVARASSRLTDSSMHDGGVDWQQGYGYQLWQCRHGAYRGDGAFGQFCLVLPALDAVVVTTAATEDMQGLLDAVWDHLLPAYADGALPEDPAAAALLASRLDTAQLPTIVSAPDAEPAGAGPWRSTHDGSSGERDVASVEVHRAAPGLWDLVVESGNQVVVPCGDGHWPALGPGPFVATGGWTAPGVFEARVVAVETPHALLVRCEGGQARVTWATSPLHSPRLADQRAPVDDLT